MKARFCFSNGRGECKQYSVQYVLSKLFGESKLLYELCERQSRVTTPMLLAT